MKISAEKGESVQSEYTVPDEDATMEFALALARFALPDTSYTIDHWLKFLRELAGEKHSLEFDKIEKTLQQIREGNTLLTLNQEKITDAKAYEIMARQVVFANDTDAIAYEQELLKHGDIIRQFMWMKYDSYCLGLWQLLQWVHDYRKKHGIRAAHVNRETICIYCKATQGDFDHVEHTIPESLGNEYGFLPRGYVCGDCMAALNSIEDGINDMLPFSLALITTSIGNKKGKLPSLKSPEIHIQKKSPNKLVFKSFGKKGELREEPVQGGGHKISITVSGRFDVHRIARMLSKAALGTIALVKGRDAVLDAKFDDIRRYIIKGGTFPNKLMIFKEGLPSPRMEAEWYEVEGVPVVKLIVLGFIFIVILGERPKFDPRDELKPHIMMYDLSLEKPEAAVEKMDGTNQT